VHTASSPSSLSTALPGYIKASLKKKIKKNKKKSSTAGGNTLTADAARSPFQNTSRIWELSSDPFP